MFFADRAHIGDIVKWGILAGLFEGLYLGMATVLLTQKYRLAALVGWELRVSFLFLLFLALSAIITTVIVFAHPLYSLIRKQYRDAAYTVLVTVLTLVAVYGFVQFTYKQLF